MPPLPNQPLFRKCDRIGLAAAAALLVFTVVGSAVLAGTPMASHGHVSDLQMRGFNPQPEPPASGGFVNPGSLRSFNPQPEPPASPLSLNPQPEPPSAPAKVLR